MSKIEIRTAPGIPVGSNAGLSSRVTTTGLRIVEIVASISDGAAGPSYSVPRLSAALVQAGAKVDLFSLGKQESSTIAGVTSRIFPHDCSGVPIVNQLRLSRSMRANLMEAAMGADLLHTHGLWLMPNVYPAGAARKAGKRFVISPRGMLGAPAMKFSRLKKTSFWKLFQRRAIQSADLLHATSEQELNDIRSAGLSNPVAVIPNGVDVPALSRPPRRGAKLVLSLGRIHPKKGLAQLVHAWARLGKRAEGWRLRIVGPDENSHAAEIRALAASLHLNSVEIQSPVFGDEKLRAYREAALFVLPTLHENFAMTVAESLAAGTPVVCTKGAPWKGLETERCGWWVDHGADSLAAALSDAMVRPEEILEAMGARGRQWMQRDFSWDRAAAEMLQAYSWTVTRGTPPPTVRL